VRRGRIRVNLCGFRHELEGAMSNHEEAIKQGAAPMLEPGEMILAAMVASPRGSTTAQMGGAAGLIGGGKAGKQREGAAEAGLVVERNSGLVLTPSRLATFRLGIGFTGSVKEVKELLGSLPLEEIDSLEVSRMGAAGVVKVTAHGTEFKLEAKAGAAKDFAEAFAQARNGA
jgi:hypothetical protein